MFSDYNGHQYLTEAAMSLVYYSLVSPISEQFQPGTGVWSYRLSSGLREEDILSPDTQAMEIKLTVNDSSSVPTFICERLVQFAKEVVVTFIYTGFKNF